MINHRIWDVRDDDVEAPLSVHGISMSYRCSSDLGIFYIINIYICTGWWFQPLGKLLVSWDYYFQYMEK